MKYLIFLWTLPQNILGLCIVYILKCEKYKTYKNVSFYKSNKLNSGVSLGNYIIIPKHRDKIFYSILESHEYGHHIQNLYLGWLYLFIIGIPSFCLNVIFRFSRRFMNNYYDLFPENWADKLGEKFYPIQRK